MDLHALIMAGGSGTRFWPASRRLRPKQLLSIGPGHDTSLIEDTVRRVSRLCPPERIFVATGEHLVEATRAALPGLPSSAFFGEPLPRNTAACIGWGTARIARADPEAIIMALPSDHYIGDEDAFLRALGTATDSARGGTITTIGIEPTRAETGYGYIEAGEAVGGGVRRVRRFVEKPDIERAQRYLASGSHFWNSGMFFFRAKDMLAAIGQHMAELDAGLRAIEEAARQGVAVEARRTREVFEALPSVSIDYGVMEKVSALNVVPAECGWSDLGSWEASYELSDKDENGNSAPDAAVLIDSRGNLVRDLRTATDDGRVIALLGVEGLCVIETDDALLVTPRERAQDVREVVSALKGARRDDLL